MSEQTEKLLSFVNAVLSGVTCDQEYDKGRLVLHYQWKQFHIFSRNAEVIRKLGNPGGVGEEAINICNKFVALNMSYVVVNDSIKLCNEVT